MLKKLSTYTLSFMATVVIPLDMKNRWTEISFGKIPANTVTYAVNNLTVHVNKSASPLVFKLDSPLNIQSVEVSLKFNGDLTNKAENAKIEDDSVFRIGLVASGDQTLTGIKKLFAPDWVKKLFALAPDGAGLDKIYFFNVGRLANQMGLSRAHPKSDLMHEEIVAIKNPDQNSLSFTKIFDKPIKSAALWISIDGDDSQSKYDTIIENITLHTADEVKGN